MSTTHSGAYAIEAAIRQANAAGRAALVAYLMLGYPSAEASLELVRAVARGGADVIELGVPFSDPVADGPVIQHAGYKALLAGATPAGCIQLAAQLRAELTQPLLLMGYYNPILAVGTQAWADRCAAAGVDGLIVPDLPPDECGPLEAVCAPLGLALVHLVAPTTGATRAAAIAERTQGFLYVVSRLGTTGQGSLPLEALRTQLTALKRVAHTPLAVGFGISTPAQAAEVAAAGADAVIVGSAVVSQAHKGPEAVHAATRALRDALSYPLPEPRPA